MNFAPFNAHTTLVFKNCNILKFAGIINVEMVYYLFQVITQSDLGENQLSIQPRLHGIIFKTS